MTNITGNEARVLLACRKCEPASPYDIAALTTMSVTGVRNFLQILASKTLCRQTDVGWISAITVEDARKIAEWLNQSYPFGNNICKIETGGDINGRNQTNKP